ncbi:MAG TPA: hypothetical protein VLW53_11380, partial [Candidatus Eisenbacteria bacterium]|nr:hypothetical protein [Candidatus Eisenbacteria bacterium]
MGETASAVPASRGLPVVVGIFEDEVRAEQAVRALEVWRSANRRTGVGPIGVVARRVSGTVTWRASGVIRPGRGALTGLVAGLVLFALPAAGAAALATWVLGSIVLGLAGLVGIVSADQAGGLLVAMLIASVALVGFLVGVVGAVLGCVVGLVVGLIDREVRGLRRSEVAMTSSALAPGSWAAVARVQPVAEPLVRDELTRLGGAPAVIQE